MATAPPSRLRGWFYARSWIGVLAAVLGCTSLGLPGHGSRLDAWHDDAAPRGLSPRTVQILRRLDLETLARKKPVEAYPRLQQLALKADDPELTYALAELSFLIGQQTESQPESHACAWYYLGAAYSYHYLFGGHSAPGQAAALRGDNGPFDPRFRLACELYNASLAHCMATAQRLGPFDPRTPVRILMPDGAAVTLSIKPSGFLWQPEEFSQLLFAANYSAVGLTNDYRTYGLGVPLIGVRDEEAVRGPQAGPRNYPRIVGFPVTAFVHFEGTLADLGQARAVVLELHNPLTELSTTVAGQTVPLETDMTTPLACSMAHTGFQQEILTGFVNAAKVEDRAGIYLFEPYQPGKIPVLMVHGLLSSPLTWAGMYNDLHVDPEIRDRFQFWFFLYPTGIPWLNSAALLRASLDELCFRLDPGGEDPALNHLVCVGHSMGGLVSKLLTVGGGDDFFRLVSAEPLSALKADRETAQDLQRLFYFAPERGVERVVFIGTPHHGSRLAHSPLGSLADDLIHLPAQVVQETQQLVQQNGLAGRTKLSTSVDLLSPHAPALELLAARQPPVTVHYHSIVGQAPKGDSLRRLDLVLGAEEQRTDGAVPYWSAHLDNAESEIVVPADHLRMQSHPQSVAEVRRILMAHWETTRPKK